jgi:hypothetical protein
MKARELGLHRLMSMHVASATPATAGERVAALGAMQAQDYAGGLWAIGLRVPDAKLEQTQAAIANRSVVRTWPLRGTLHFVAAADVYWLGELLGPRVISAAATRHRELELDAKLMRKAEKAVFRALTGGKQLTRAAIGDVLARAGIQAEGPRLYHILWRLSVEQLLCFGVPQGKQQTFTLLHEWIPRRASVDPEAAVIELAVRYFTSHGPASQQDLMRWAGLTAQEAKLGIAGAGARIARVPVDDVDYWMAADAEEPTAAVSGTFMLPGFDEYILGYKDRSSVLDPRHASKIVPGNNGMFRPTIVHNGRVIGTWSAVATKRSVRVTADGFEPLTKAQARAFEQVAQRYAAFLGKAAAQVT